MRMCPGIALAGSAIGTSAFLRDGRGLLCLHVLIVADRSRLPLQDKQFGGNSRWLEERLRVGGSCAMPHWKRKIPNELQEIVQELNKAPQNTKSRFRRDFRKVYRDDQFPSGEFHN